MGSSLPAANLGTFASLFEGLAAALETVLVAHMIPELPTNPVACDASHASATPKGKDAKSGMTSGGPAKKDGLQSKARSVPIVVPSMPPLINPPIVLSAQSGKIDSPSKTSSIDFKAESAGPTPADAAVVRPGITSPRPSASALASDDEATPMARLAFGLRLTPLDPATEWPARSQVQSSRGLETNIRPAVADPEPHGPQAQVLSIDIAASNSDRSLGDKSAPRGGAESDQALTLSSWLDKDPSRSNDAVTIPGFQDGSTHRSSQPAAMSSDAGDPNVRREPLRLANDPTMSPDEARLTQHNPSSSEIINLAQEPNKVAPVSSTESAAGTAQFVDLQTSSNRAGIQQPIANKTLAAVLEPSRDASTSNLTAPKEVALPKDPQHLVGLGSNEKAPALVTLRPDDAESNHDQSTANANNAEQAEPRAAAVAALEVRTLSDATTAINSQTLKSQTLTPPATSQTRTAQQATSRPATSQTTTSQTSTSPATSRPASKTTTAQPAVLQTTAAQTAPSESSHSVTPSRTTPLQASANSSITDAPSSPQPMASAGVSHSTDAPLSPKLTNEIEINPGVQPQPARQISLKLIGEDSTKVSVDLSERGGRVQVAVRSADPELTRSLRSDLGDLVGRLESKGFKTEAWVPSASRHMSAASAEPSNSNSNPSSSRDTNSGTNQRQWRQGQNGSNQRQHARWMAQLEETITTEEKRIENQ